MPFALSFDQVAALPVDASRPAGVQRAVRAAQVVAPWSTPGFVVAAGAPWSGAGERGEFEAELALLLARSAVAVLARGPFEGRGSPVPEDAGWAIELRRGAAEPGADAAYVEAGGNLEAWSGARAEEAVRQVLDAGAALLEGEEAEVVVRFVALRGAATIVHPDGGGAPGVEVGGCDAGVAFSRDPRTGAAGLVGAIAGGPGFGTVWTAALEANGAGRPPDLEPLDALAARHPEPYAQLVEATRRLEVDARDLVEVAFQVAGGRLWIHEAGPARRSARAALEVLVELVADDAIGLGRVEALRRVRVEDVDGVLHPSFSAGGAVLARGLGASPGAAVGRVYFSADAALDAFERGEDVILVRPETTPDDIHGMEVSQGILTSRGGLASHAAVVARGWGIPAVVGAEAVSIGDRFFSVAGVRIPEGQVISLNGSTGEVLADELTTVEADPSPALATLLSWADELRAGRVGVRANADSAPDARRARDFGAEGIGLCRTEHMFLGPQRLPIVRRAILAADAEAEEQALEQLVVQQRADFVELLEAMDAMAVTVRLLDPPLHEFLPSIEDVVAAEAAGNLSDAERALHAAVRVWREQNPMLGTRGVRLGVLRPALYRAQVRALAEAVARRVADGGNPLVEIMIPLVVSGAELAHVRRVVEDTLAECGVPRGEGRILIGAMIETPRAALRAADLAASADFVSFGTNDLTQMTFGFSRDDVEGRIMGPYLEAGLLEHNPFAHLDARGVGELVELGVERGRSARPGLKIGVCGEHGGDPSSIALLVAAGVDYVSCSPFRVPIARIAAALAVHDRR